MAIEQESGKMKTLRDILNEQAGQLDELSKKTLGSYINKASYDKGEREWVDGYKQGSNENDYTIYNKSKKILRRDSGIRKATERLTKEGLELEEARHKKDEGGEDSEASQNIVTQLRKAHASMEGGAKIYFKDGKSHFVAGHHAGKLLDKHADMKPVAKAAFQAKIHKSHDSLKSEL